ncbi:hypothetical protein ACWEQV_12600 [Rhodococcus aetherivorans]|uniref:hypothetical protein n=1 Tax=Rhodococcus sp. GXMU-t2271 TaxID=3059079 RepID=UPI00352AC65D
MTDRSAFFSLPDPDRTLLLGNGWRASVCITPRGDASLWLVAHHDDGIGCACLDCAPHEHPSRPMPTRILAALDARTTLRCGRPRTDGQPCRTVVARRGATCRWHRSHAIEEQHR